MGRGHVSGRLASSILVVALLAPALAGCFGKDDASPPPQVRANARPYDDDYVGPLEAPERILAKRPIQLRTTGCNEGGPHTVTTSATPLPAPWKPKEIGDYIGGDASLGNLPRAEDGLGQSVYGIYHAIVVCATWSVNGYEGEPFVWGFVGAQVEPPPFDAGGADIHYLIYQLTVATPELADFLQGRGYSATFGAGIIETRGPLHHTVLMDQTWGTSESFMKMREDRAKPTETIRLWMLTQNWDGSWSPSKLDLSDEGGSHWVADGYALANQSPPNATAEQSVAGQDVGAGLLFTGFQRVITLGKPLDVRLSQGWAP